MTEPISLPDIAMHLHLRHKAKIRLHTWALSGHAQEVLIVPPH
jgi:hypothetical protein